MTYCVAIKVKDGLVALADGRITAGNQMTSAQKIALFGEGSNRFFVMTSGLRSVRDKVFAYLQQDMKSGTTFDTMLDMIGVYTKHLRRVESEDREYIEKSYIAFNLHSIVGGMMDGDSEPRMFLVYPEGNWIEVEENTPYLSIGTITYGKPILDRTLRPSTDMKTAIKTAYLSFDSTKFSSSDVGFPIDIFTLSLPGREWRSVRLANEDVKSLRDWWNHNITQLVTRAPDCDWMAGVLSEAAG